MPPSRLLKFNACLYNSNSHWLAHTLTHSLSVTLPYFLILLIYLSLRVLFFKIIYDVLFSPHLEDIPSTHLPTGFTLDLQRSLALVEDR